MYINYKLQYLGRKLKKHFLQDSAVRRISPQILHFQLGPEMTRYILFPPAYHVNTRLDQIR